ncbi:TIGR01212 family radical SAM protein [Anaerotignum lactatifermentans]|uniref:TIGR01212 family radical SAM protein n=1 Tax=Anaerotignum lactatifermentans TaxID=160404 RepID=A0ABS2GCB0_9FIRM|nr:TIGR01212 family radical SAM protein [Anaerotignum lactatifermentans]MBM6828682.1 TIGR01212 family radical SAM protein [Anaerotignum lactatifermentans]MBM6878795.1 TIGR01212 family radical SAM protein [Anaerotignum lactatifermentans]MBM6950264.1 TIGR01212 family radical SAM protein [Anaerotignum lactatifermentans]
MAEKPYRDLNTYYREIFGKKTAKISLNGGFTCPNRDGTLGTGGCVFCSAGGSGDFAESPALSIPEQIQKGKAQTAKKWEDPAYIAYFQAFTNTYAPAEVLRRVYGQAIDQPEIRGLSIATRPDCMGQEVLDLLEELSQNTHLWVEFGLQTSNEHTAALIRRGYPNDTFAAAVKQLHLRRIPVIAHVILGLPEEGETEILSTMDFLNELPISGVKLHLLHVIEGTELARWYQEGRYVPLAEEEYIRLVCRCIARLRPDIVIHRLTGDGDKNSLLAPLWSRNKRHVLNQIHHRLRLENITQGMDWPPSRQREGQ